MHYPLLAALCLVSALWLFALSEKFICMTRPGQAMARVSHQYFSHYHATVSVDGGLWLFLFQFVFLYFYKLFFLLA